MSGEHEYAFWPWVIPWLRPGGYSMRPCDIPQDRFLDTTEVQDTTEAPWQDSPVKDEFVRLPVPWRRWSNGGPRTMVTAHPTVREKWTIGTSQYGYYDAWLPVPKTGSHREENNPRPLWQMASSNHYDKLEILVHEDGRVIGAHLIGQHAAELINYFSFIIQNNLSHHHMKHLQAAYPTAASDLNYLT